MKQHFISRDIEINQYTWEFTKYPNFQLINVYDSESQPFLEMRFGEKDFEAIQFFRPLTDKEYRTAIFIYNIKYKLLKA